MPLTPNIHTAAVAGTQRAASRGGAAETQSHELSQSQSIATNPAGKPADAHAIDAGGQIGDRRGDGRQPLDSFQRGDQTDGDVAAGKPLPQQDLNEDKQVDYHA